jgi:hypothetical protein
MFPCVATALIALTAGAFAQVATAPASTPRPLDLTVASVPVAPGGGLPQIEDQNPTLPPQPPQPAQTPQAVQPPRPARAPEAPTAIVAPIPPRSRGQLVNLRLEFTITDQIGTATPVKKTVMMNVADGESGRIRTNADVLRANTIPMQVPLSVDASPEVEGNKIRLRASLDYQLLNERTGPDQPAGKTSITQSVTSILNDGVPTILSQSADPLTDRKVTLEVKATIIR